MAGIGSQSYDQTVKKSSGVSGKSHLIEYSASASATAELSSTQTFSLGMSSKISASLGKLALTAGLADTTTFGANITTTYADAKWGHQDHSLGRSLGALSLSSAVKTTGLTQLFTTQSMMGYKLSTRAQLPRTPVLPGWFGGSACKLFGSSLDVAATAEAAAKATSGMAAAKAAAMTSAVAMSAAIAGFSFPAPKNGSKYKGNVCPDVLQTSLVAAAASMTFLLPAITMLCATKRIQNITTPRNVYNGKDGYGSPNELGIRMDVTTNASSALSDSSGFSGKSVLGDVSLQAGEFGIKLSKTGGVNVTSGSLCKFSVGPAAGISMMPGVIEAVAQPSKIIATDGAVTVAHGNSAIVLTAAAINANGTTIGGGVVVDAGITNMSGDVAII